MSYSNLGEEFDEIRGILTLLTLSLDPYMLSYLIWR